MNNAFSFSRLGMLVSAHWAENRKRYRLAIIAATGLLIFWYFVIVLSDSYRPLEETVQWITFFFGLFVVGTLYAGQFWSPLGSKTRAIPALTLPATTGEKTWVGILYTLVGFPLVWLAIYYGVTTAFVGVLNHVHPAYLTPDRYNNITGAPLANVFQLDGGFTTDYFWLVFLALQSIALLGSVYFNNYAFLKTAIAVLLFSLIFYLFEVSIMEGLLPDGSPGDSLLTYRFYGNDTGGSKLVRLPQWIELPLSLIGKWIWAPLFCTVAYFRLREKQV